jgi:hypothetical protein
MGEQTERRARGRPPKHGEAMSGASRQSLYAKARQRDMAEVAFALKTVLARSRAERKAFIEVYKGTISGERFRRGLGRMLIDEPDTLAFFDGLFSSDDEK